MGGMVPGSSPLYHCHCQEGFTGKNCEGMVFEAFLLYISFTLVSPCDKCELCIDKMIFLQIPTILHKLSICLCIPLQ